VSTIKVDTYLTRGGASEIAIDKLKGASSAGSMTVVGEGGTNTTNLQQGLAKAWVNYDAVSQVTHGSFNQSSLTDNGTGDFTTTYSNNLSGAEDKCITFGIWNTSNNGGADAADNTRGPSGGGQRGGEASATSKVRYTSHYGSTATGNGALFDFEATYCATLGDLA